MNQLAFKFTATFSEAWPKLKFYVNDDLYHDYQFNQAEGYVSLPIDLLDGEHLLEIELYDKPINSTKIENGVIVQDQLVTLENMYIDNVCLPKIFIYSGRYEHIPDSIAVTWGINGKWSFKFSTPLISWAMDFKNSLSEDHSKTSTVVSTYSDQKNKKILAILDQIESELQDVRI